MHVDDQRHVRLTRPESSRARGPRLGLAFVVLCTTIFVWTAPGRIVFPDDEIVFQTTRSMWERGSLAVEGIAKRTGEPDGRPSGTFGWAPGVDGRRFGFFGHALSVVALPAYGLGKVAAEVAPPVWRHAIRSDEFFFHRRSHTGDWTRLLVTLTNTWVTALAAWMLVLWLRVLGTPRASAVIVGLAYALGTAAWPFSGTHLSEPLSALMLLCGAWAVAHFHRARQTAPGHASASRWLWLAGAIVGLSVHAHVLNLVMVPCFLGYALWPLHRERAWSSERAAWIGALTLGAAAVVALGLSHWVRFGDPFETGRHGHYSHFIVPGNGLLAMLVSPGRSLFVYSPALLVALPGWPRLLRRMPVEGWFALSCVAVRLLFVATRSDWWGGWAIGPRFLLPIIPFGLMGLLEVLRDATTRRRVAVVGACLVACALLELHLSTHSIFEWMLHIYQTTPESVGYLERSHWSPAASPIVGFWGRTVDTLSAGAVRLAQRGHPGLLMVFVGIAVVGAAAGFALFRRLAAGRGRLHGAG